MVQNVSEQTSLVFFVCVIEWLIPFYGYRLGNPCWYTKRITLAFNRLDIVAVGDPLDCHYDISMS
jgi:hypothetical protein